MDDEERSREAGTRPRYGQACRWLIQLQRVMHLMRASECARWRSPGAALVEPGDYVYPFVTFGLRLFL
jgi:hypothetical protein